MKNKFVNPFERMFVSIFVLFFILLTILSSVITFDLTQQKHTKRERSSDTCRSKICSNAAMSIKRSIDTSVQPCDNFYKFVCGNWIKSNSIPPGYSSLSKIMQLDTINKQIMKTFVESDISSELTRSNTEWKVKQFYRSCMDLGGHKEKLDFKPILPYIKTIQGWTISSIEGVKFDEEAKWDFQELLQKINSLFLTEFFDVAVIGNDLKPSKKIITIIQTEMLNKEMFEKKSENMLKNMAAYKEHLLELGMFMGGTKEHTQKCLEEVIEFQTELVKITETPAELSEEYKTVKQMSISQLQKEYPFINWLEFLTNVFKEYNIQIRSNEKIRVLSRLFFKRLTILINKTVKTAKGRRQIQNFVVWNMLHAFAPMLSKKFRESYDKFQKVISGIVGEKEDWKKCLKKVEERLSFGLSAIFVKEKFKAENKDYATEIILKIKDIFISNLPSLTWMDQTTREAATKKANAMLYLIGYPDFILNNTLLDNFYRKYEVKENKYVENFMRLFSETLKENYSKLRLNIDVKEWPVPPTEVNAFYQHNQNKMIFLAGLLQEKWFSKDLPDWYNFGGMGFVAGHELTHGFDDTGSLYDSKGRFRKWWGQKVKKKFDERTQCFVDKYSKYKVDGINVDGKFTLGENIADNAGLKLSYNAYINLNNNKATLIGLPYNHKQLFFISAAKQWCIIENKESRAHKRRTNEHANAEFRVIGSMSNLPEFSEAFNCPLDSTMNPRTKCNVW